MYSDFRVLRNAGLGIARSAPYDRESQPIRARSPRVDDLLEAIVVSVVVRLNAQGLAGSRRFDVDLATVEFQLDPERRGHDRRLLESRLFMNEHG